MGRCSSALLHFLELRQWLLPDPARVLTAPEAAHEERAFRQMMGPYDVHAELNKASDCYFPQIEHADTLVAALPHTCFVVTSRPADDWAHSVRAYSAHYHGPTANKSSLMGALLSGCARRNMRPHNESDLVPWYTQHMLHVHAAISRAQCSVAVNIEEPDAGERLARAFPGTHASCWRQANPTRARMP